MYPSAKVGKGATKQPWLEIVFNSLALFSRPARFEKADEMGSITENRSMLKKFLAVSTLHLHMFALANTFSVNSDYQRRSFQHHCPTICPGDSINCRVPSLLGRTPLSLRRASR